MSLNAKRPARSSHPTVMPYRLSRCRRTRARGQCQRGAGYTEIRPGWRPCDAPMQDSTMCRGLSVRIRIRTLYGHYRRSLRRALAIIKKIHFAGGLRAYCPRRSSVRKNAPSARRVQGRQGRGHRAAGSSLPIARVRPVRSWSHRPAKGGHYRPGPGGLSPLIRGEPVTT